MRAGVRNDGRRRARAWPIITVGDEASCLNEFSFPAADGGQRFGKARTKTLSKLLERDAHLARRARSRCELAAATMLAGGCGQAIPGLRRTKARNIQGRTEPPGTWRRLGPWIRLAPLTLLGVACLPKSDPQARPRSLIGHALLFAIIHRSLR